jgi:acyl transferase domain-containing protein
VNNFGYGGANAHAIIEDASYLTSASPNRYLNGNSPGKRYRPRIFKLSAKDETAARLMATNLGSYLSRLNVENRTSNDFLDRLAFTLGEKRSHFAWNSAFVGESVDGLVSVLPGLKPRRAPKPPRLGFVFTGQGAQWYAMGRELIKEYPVFKMTLLEAESCLKDLGASWSLKGMK